MKAASLNDTSSDTSSDALRTIDLLLSGGVRRWHTEPLMPPQSVAEHAWLVAVIYFRLFGDTERADTIPYLLLHDAAELFFGDLPAPLKRQHPPSYEQRDCEAKWLEAKSGLRSAEHHDARTSLCDRLADIFHCATLTRAGNTYAADVMARTVKWIEPQLRDFPSARDLCDSIVAWSCGAPAVK